MSSELLKIALHLFIIQYVRVIVYVHGVCMCVLCMFLCVYICMCRVFVCMSACVLTYGCYVEDRCVCVCVLYVYIVCVCDIYGTVYLWKSEQLRGIGFLFSVLNLIITVKFGIKHVTQ